jgi:hypothetical protein
VLNTPLAVFDCGTTGADHGQMRIICSMPLPIGYSRCVLVLQIRE